MTNKLLTPSFVVFCGRVFAGGVLVAAVVLALSSLRALDTLPDRGVAADLAAVPPDALGFVHLRVQDLWQSDLGKGIRQSAPKDLMDELSRVEQWLGVGVNDLERLTAVVLPGDALSRLGGPFVSNIPPEAIVVAATLRPYDRVQLLSRILGKSRVEAYRTKTLYTSSNEFNSRAVYLINERMFAVADRPEALRPLLRHSVRPRGEGPLSAALKHAASQHVLVAAAAPTALEATLSGAMTFRGSFGSTTFPVFTRLLGAEMALLTCDMPAGKLRLALDLSYGDEGAARRALPASQMLWGLIQDAVADAADEPDVGSAALLWGHVEHALDGARVERRGTGLRLGIDMDVSEHLRATLPELALRVKQSRDRSQSINNLKQIALACHAYHDTYAFFPKDFADRQGKPLLSWRVAILPFLNEGKLYTEFKLNEPWDSEHNKKLLARMPTVLAPIGSAVKEPFGTFYQGFAGPGTIFGNPLGTRMGQVVDGMSNTLLVVEAGEAVPWTKPADLAYDPKKPLPKLGGMFQEGFAAAFCDGSVHFIRRNFDEQTLRWSITMNDGMITDISKLTGERRRPMRGVQTFNKVGAEIKMAVPAPVMKK